MKYKIFIALTLTILIACLFSTELAAQCPMCRMSAESNMKGGGTAGRGLNAGILYMLSLPYIIVACVAYWWWKNRKSDSDPEMPDSLLTEDPARHN